MTPLPPTPLNAVAEEFARAEEYWKQRALLRAIEVDVLRAKVPADPEQEQPPGKTPPDESRPD